MAIMVNISGKLELKFYLHRYRTLTAYFIKWKTFPLSQLRTLSSSVLLPCSSDLFLLTNKRSKTFCMKTREGANKDICFSFPQEDRIFLELTGHLQNEMLLEKVLDLLPRMLLRSCMWDSLSSPVDVWAHKGDS